MEKSNLDIQKGNSLFVASLAKGMQVLSCFQGGKRELLIREICDLSGFDRSLVQRLTNTLHKQGYLNRNDRTRGYSLSLKLLSFSFAYLNANPLMEAAMPRMVGLSEAMQTRVSLSAHDDLDVVLVARIPKAVFYHPTAHFGERQPAYCTSSGRIILAVLPEDQQLDILTRSDRKAVTSQTKTNIEDIMAEFISIREQGYCQQSHEFIAGETSISVPIFDAQNRPCAALSVSMLRDENLSEERIDQIVISLIHTGDQISRSLGATKN